MAISYKCSSCGKSYKVGDEHAGKLAQCKQCGERMRIPMTSGSDRLGLEMLASESAEPPPLLPRGSAYRPAPPPRVEELPRPRKKKKSKGKPGSLFGSGGYNGDYTRYLVGVGLVVVVVLFRVAVKTSMRNDMRAAQEQRQPQDPGAAPAFVPDQAPSTVSRDGPIALPAFPDPGPGREIEPGVVLHEIILGPPDPVPGQPPGHCGRLWLYLPSGQHPAKSLPCILIAGATLFSGMKLADGDVAEHLPYVRAGYAVLAFEVDGMLANRQNASEQEIRQAATRFQDARAGLVNAHIALEYALAKVPEVDPSRITAAGHSSAGTLALLFAEHEPRLRSCIAYAPVSDIATHFRKFNMEGLMQALIEEGYGDLFGRYAPLTNEARLDRPLFLFYALDDASAPEIAALADRLKARRLPVTVSTVPSGGHYDPMIEQGIPGGLAWLLAQ